MAIRKIRELGDEVLTKPCKEETRRQKWHLEQSELWAMKF